MSDIRGIPRRSKTAVVVVLVVFLQMLALAVVGIGAIKEDRERGRQTRIRENEDAARLRVAQLRQDTLKELAGTPGAERGQRRVEDIMLPAGQVEALAPDDNGWTSSVICPRII